MPDENVRDVKRKHDRDKETRKRVAKENGWRQPSTPEIYRAVRKREYNAIPLEGNRGRYLAITSEAAPLPLLSPERKNARVQSLFN